MFYSIRLQYYKKILIKKNVSWNIYALFFLFNVLGHFSPVICLKSRHRQAQNLVSEK